MVNKGTSASVMLRLLLKRPRMTAKEVSSELDVSKQYVYNVTRVLRELGLVSDVSRGVYEITEAGVERLNALKRAEMATQALDELRRSKDQKAPEEE